jgi:capsid protein
MLKQLVDGAVSVFSPARGLARAQMRVREQRVLAYTAGQLAPRGKEWRASRKGPNAELRDALGWLRRRSRELVRDNAMASRMVSIAVAHEIGYGIKPRSITGDEALDKKVVALWNRFVARSDLHGRLDLYGQQVQMATVECH